MNFLYVFIGGGLGSICRYAIAIILKKQHLDFPLATLIANVIACLILGCFIALAAKGNLSNVHKLLFMTGFCGGFSTFSTFSAETFDLFQTGNISYALLNIFLSLAICLFAIFIGNLLGNMMLN